MEKSINERRQENEKNNSGKRYEKKHLQTIKTRQKCICSLMWKRERFTEKALSFDW